jgi:hypothetical protein
MRGKRRLHKRPDNYEIERCKIWLELERDLVNPNTIVALGVTAARSLTGRTLTIARVLGKPISMADGARLFVTLHPSALLRIEDKQKRHAAYRSFVAGLKAAARSRTLVPTGSDHNPVGQPILYPLSARDPCKQQCLLINQDIYSAVFPALLTTTARHPQRQSPPGSENPPNFPNPGK